MTGFSTQCFPVRSLTRGYKKEDQGKVPKNEIEIKITSGYYLNQNNNLDTSDILKL